MRSRLSANTPASMPDRKNESARDKAMTRNMAQVFSTSTTSFFPTRRDFDKQLAHPAFVRRRGRQLQSPEDNGLAHGRDGFQLQEEQPAHRIDFRHTAELRILAPEILQPHHGVNAPAARPEFFHHQSLLLAFPANFPD